MTDPAMLRKELRARLDGVRKFRHFFRHNYAVTLRADAIASVGQQYQLVAPAFRQAVERFLAAVDAMMDR